MQIICVGDLCCDLVVPYDDAVLIGFPIWYGGAPNVVNSFCSGYDFTGKGDDLVSFAGKVLDRSFV